MDQVPPSLPLRRVAIELVNESEVAPAATLAEETFEVALDLVARSPEIAVIDLGIRHDATAHPAFAELLERAAAGLGGRGGTVVVWVAAPGLQELSPLPDGATLAFGLLPGSPAGTLDVLTKRFAQVGAVRADDREAAQVPLAVRPDRPPVAGRAPFGGCPILEQGALFVGVEGALHACQRHLAAGAPIADGLGGVGAAVPDALARMRHLLRLDRRADASPICAGCPLGLADVKGSALGAYWVQRDEEGAIGGLDERIHLFREAAPTPHRAIRLDLGCGPARTPGFIGVDRFALPGVDVVCDLDRPLPFPDGSVDYVIASHSLEHIADLPRTIEEIYRICRDRAIVTIVSPYHATGLNRANPYHKQVFNEHTARFFTKDPSTKLVDPEEFDFPHAHVWGLGHTDHSDWRVDLRPLHTEYFYFAPYRALDEASKRVLRQHLSNVCDQMLTHLLVVKSRITDEEIQSIAKTADFQETSSLRMRRALEERHGAPDAFAALPGLTERLWRFEKELVRGETARQADAAAQQEATATLAALTERLGGIENDLARGQTARQADAAAQQEATATLAALTERLGTVERNLARGEAARQAGTAAQQKTAAVLDTVHERLGRIENDLARGQTARQADAAAQQEATATLAALTMRMGVIEEHLSRAVHGTEASGRRLDAHDAKLREVERFDEFAARLMADVVTPRKRIDRPLRMLRHAVGSPDDFTHRINPVFQPLLEASLLNNGVTSSHVLTLTSYIAPGDTFVYPITAKDMRVDGLELALFAINPPLEDTPFLVVEVYDQRSGTARGSGTLVANKGDLVQPVRVIFDPITLEGKRTVEIRIAGTEAARRAGLRTLEWRRRRVLPLPGLYDPRLFGRLMGARLSPTG